MGLDRSAWKAEGDVLSKEKTTHQVLARKYRPRGFDELVGQPGVSQTLKNALKSGRIHHAYLFTGPRGCGKTTTARILAKALNCVKGPTPEPCDDCTSCREIANSSALDVLEMDAASHTGVDNVREVIVETVALAPTRDRYKVFIIDETHMLSTAAFNALLKTIEEPPAHVVFILATTEVHKVPATVASRCQRYKFRPVSPEPLAEHLAGIAKKENMNVDPAALQLLARAAEGSLRDAVSLLDQCRSVGDGRVSLESVREMFGFVPAEMLVTTAKALLEHDPKTLALELKKVYDEGVEPAQFLKDLRSALEVVYLQKLGVGTDSDPVWTSVVAAATPEALGFLLRRINRALEELRFGDSPRLALELGLFSAIEAAHDLSAWVSRLEALEKRLSAGGGGPSLSRIAPAVIIPETKTQPSAVNPPAAPKAGALWEQFIEAVSREKISLGAALHSCSQSLNSNGGWVIRFNKPFDLEAAERSREFLEKTLVALGGPDRRMEFSLAQTAPVVMTDIIDPAIAPTPGGDPPGAHWKDVTDIPKNVSGLKEAEGVFGGKARIVKSRPKSA